MVSLVGGARLRQHHEHTRPPPSHHPPGTIAGTPVVVLVHGKIGPSTALTVKTQVQALSERIAQQLQAALSH